MRINDENTLREMKKASEKSKRANKYDVEYMNDDGTYGILKFVQGYDHSCDVYHPFFVKIYLEGSCVAASSGKTIEDSYNRLMVSFFENLSRHKKAKEEAQIKLAKIYGILKPEEDEEDEEDEMRF